MNFLSLAKTASTNSNITKRTLENMLDNHKRDTEPLAHVQRHAVLKVHLVFFQELDEEAEGEYFRQAESEEETAVIGQGGFGLHGG